jgi:hypothetical protein
MEAILETFYKMENQYYQSKLKLNVVKSSLFDF